MPRRYFPGGTGYLPQIDMDHSLRMGLCIVAVLVLIILILGAGLYFASKIDPPDLYNTYHFNVTPENYPDITCKGYVTIHNDASSETMIGCGPKVRASKDGSIVLDVNGDQ